MLDPYQVVVLRDLINNETDDQKKNQIKHVVVSNGICSEEELEIVLSKGHGKKDFSYWAFETASFVKNMILYGSSGLAAATVFYNAFYNHDDNDQTDNIDVSLPKTTALIAGSISAVVGAIAPYGYSTYKYYEAKRFFKQLKTALDPIGIALNQELLPKKATNVSTANDLEGQPLLSMTNSSTDILSSNMRHRPRKRRTLEFELAEIHKKLDKLQKDTDGIPSQLATASQTIQKKIEDEATTVKEQVTSPANTTGKLLKSLDDEVKEVKKIQATQGQEIKTISENYGKQLLGWDLVKEQVMSFKSFFEGKLNIFIQSRSTSDSVLRNELDKNTKAIEQLNKKPQLQ